MVRGPVVVLRCASGVGGLVATLGLLATAAAADESWPRWYWGVRLGAAITVDTDATSDVKTSRSDQVTGMSVGVDLGRHRSLEVAADVFETALQHGPLDRTIGELGVLTVIPQARLRYPLPGRRVTA